jgi:hypothetical protein
MRKSIPVLAMSVFLLEVVSAAMAETIYVDRQNPPESQ